MNLTWHTEVSLHRQRRDSEQYSVYSETGERSRKRHRKSRNGCLSCKHRRIKCSEDRPACSNCTRLQKVCEYINEQTTSSRNMQETRRIVGPPLPPVMQPAMDADEAAIGAYYASYCITSSTICSLDHIQKQGNGCLLAAIKMLGMLQIHQKWHLPPASNKLCSLYAAATTSLNAALKSHSHALKDSTLMATLLLSIAEMKSSPDFTLRYWLVHTKGACALIEARGPSQVTTRSGAALFLQFSSQIVVYCILGKRPVPSELQKTWRRTHSYLLDKQEEHPLWKWHGVMYRFANFAASNRHPNPATESIEAQAIIDEALAIYQDIEEVFRKAGVYWLFETQPVDDFDEVVTHRHVYKSLLSARVWNDRRTATVLLFEIIADVATAKRGLEGLNKPSDAYVEKAQTMIGNTALEILAAVPQMIEGLKGKSQSTAATEAPPISPGLQLCDSNSEYQERVFEETQPNVPLPYMDTCRVMWPVYFAAQCCYIAPRVRDGLLSVLEDAGNTMQIVQWQILASSVKHKCATFPAHHSSYDSIYTYV